MGEDSWLSLTAWFEWPELLKLAHLVVMRRPAGDGPQTAAESALSPELTRLKQQHQVESPELLTTRPSGQIYFTQSPVV